MRKIVVFFLVLAVFGILSARSKFNESTIKEELKKPGVKLVAIDFYMTGCPPCDAAIPEWKKLKKQYGDALKLIVVAPMRDNGSCVVKDWRPDKMICDEDMEIAGSWGVKDFPQAFLYSWHNNDPLVQLGHVKDVEKAIKAYFKEIPRVVLDADSSSRNLVPKVEEALRMNSKIELVSSAAEQKQLLALKKQSHQLNYDEDLKCELGKEISANSVLKITKEDGDLVLRLSSVEKSCTMAAATKSLSGDKQKLKTEVAAAVYELLSQMFGNISIPDEGGKPPQKVVETSVKSRDLRACDYAKNENSVEAWQDYLDSFPDGECSLEAKQQIKKSTSEELNIKGIKNFYYIDDAGKKKPVSEVNKVSVENGDPNTILALYGAKMKMYREQNNTKEYYKSVDKILQISRGAEFKEKAELNEISIDIIAEALLEELLPEFNEYMSIKFDNIPFPKKHRGYELLQLGFDVENGKLIHYGDADPNELYPEEKADVRAAAKIKDEFNKISQDRMVKKIELTVSLSQKYEQIIKIIYSKRFTPVVLYYIGKIYKDLADQMSKAPITPWLSEAQISEYKNYLDEKAFGAAKNARTYFEVVIKKGSEKSISTKLVDKAKYELQQLKKDYHLN